MARPFLLLYIEYSIVHSASYLNRLNRSIKIN